MNLGSMLKFSYSQLTVLCFARVAWPLVELWSSVSQAWRSIKVAAFTVHRGSLMENQEHHSVQAQSSRRPTGQPFRGDTVSNFVS